jgi:hypothetical protein
MLILEAIASGARCGAPDTNGRAVVEDLERLLSELARAHPDAFLDGLERWPALRQTFAVVSALGALEIERARVVLAELLAAKDGAIRWLALESLLRRGDARGIARIAKALSDRDGLVVFSAVSFARRWGTADDLPKLIRIATAPKTPPGTREAAWDAVECIVARSGLPTPDGAPSPRLVKITLPSGSIPKVLHSELVQAGAVLASGPNGAIVAPTTGVVIEIDVASSELILRASKT